MAPAGSRTIQRRDRKKFLLQLLRQVRQKAGLRQIDLAQRLGKPQSFVSKYESGERRLDLLEIEELCQAVGISLMTFAKRFERSSRGMGKGRSQSG